MSYRVRLDHDAEKKLRSLSQELAANLLSRIQALAQDPRPHDCKKLKDSKTAGWRIRVGKYRVLYLVDDAGREVQVYDIDLRDRVYKKRQ